MLHGSLAILIYLDICMMTLIRRFPFIIIFSLLFVGCSPHPGTGVWQANDGNILGITRLVVGFEGRAEFTTSKQDNAVWHCFWGVTGDKELSLECTPSTNPDNNKSFVLTVNDKGFTELREGSSSVNEAKLLATFVRLDENPSPKK